MTNIQTEIKLARRLSKAHQDNTCSTSNSAEPPNRRTAEPPRCDAGWKTSACCGCGPRYPVARRRGNGTHAQHGWSAAGLGALGLSTRGLGALVGGTCARRVSVPLVLSECLQRGAEYGERISPPLRTQTRRAVERRIGDSSPPSPRSWCRVWS